MEDRNCGLSQWNTMRIFRGKINIYEGGGREQRAMRNGTKYSLGLKIQWLPPPSHLLLSEVMVNGILRVHAVKFRVSSGSALM